MPHLLATRGRSVSLGPARICCARTTCPGWDRRCGPVGRAGHRYVEGVRIGLMASSARCFAITAPVTRMLGLLTTDVFEPFFDRTGIATDDSIYTEGLVDPSTLFQRLGQIGDLDVTMVCPSPRRTFAPGL